MKKLNTLFILAAIIIQSCIPRSDLKHFTLYNTSANFTSSKLRVNGLYATVIEDNIGEKKRYYPCFFALYEDGIFLDMWCSDDSTLTNIAKEAQEKINFIVKYKHKLNLANQSVSQWGRFQIRNDTIIIQDFVHCNRPWIYVVRERKGEIINDLTLVIHSEEEFARCNWEDNFRKVNMRDEGLNRVYHFYRTDQKPDSINQFMTDEKLRHRIEKKLRKNK
ncbi:MAG: hypothetical protein H7Y04_09345 [Verrucomicrobia bacterium]|nr:hypothetical protein [Cytophagales bacterium]